MQLLQDSDRTLYARATASSPSFLTVISLVLATTGLAHAGISGPLIVNIQIDMETNADQAGIHNLLATIEAYDGHATVFVPGALASLQPDMIRNIQARTHQIAIHGWQTGEDLTPLGYNEQLTLIQDSFAAVRSAVAHPEAAIDFKPQGYGFNTDTIRVLQALQARSISGLFPCDEDFCHCWYAQGLGKITFPYPVTTGFWAVPISEVTIDAQDIPLDDTNFDNPSEYFARVLEKYNQQRATGEPLIISLHPSIAGMEEPWSNALDAFLDYAKSTGAKIGTLDSICHFTTYISDFDATGPDSAFVSEQITISVAYTSNLWCPSYRFRAYGRYPGQEWTLLASHCEFVYLGSHAFDFTATIPAPPVDEDLYTIRAVGRASFGGCAPSDYWPSFDSYEVKDEFTLQIHQTCLPVPGRPIGAHLDKLDLVFVPDDDYGLPGDIDSWLPGFLSRVNHKIDNRLGGQPPVSPNLDRFNFFYTRVQGSVSEDNCGRRSSLPHNLFQDCPFADAVVVLHSSTFTDCSTVNQRPSVYSAEGPTDRSFIHESGHGLFGLADEYDGDPNCRTRYFQPNPKANIWHTLHACTTDAAHQYRQGVTNEFLGSGTGEETTFGPVTNGNAANAATPFFADIDIDGDIDPADVSLYVDDHHQLPDAYVISTATGTITLAAPPARGTSVSIDYSYVLDEDWNPTNCRRFTTCQGNWWKLGTTPYIMVDGDHFSNGWGKPASRRADWVLSQYQDPPQLDKTIILELNITDDVMTLLASQVVPGFSPNYIPGGYEFTAELRSLAGELIGEYGFGDPRIILGEQGYEGPAFLESVDFPLGLPYFHNAGVVNIFASGQLILSINIADHATAVLEGTVTESGGLPTSGALVQVSGPGHTSTRTDGSGYYRFPSLQPGTYDISVLPDPYANVMPASASVGASPGETTVMDFTLAPAASIAGGVTDAAASPVPGASVYLSGYEPPFYTTDDDGEYIIPALPAGTHTINIDTPGPWYILVDGSYIADEPGTSATVSLDLGDTTWVDFTQVAPSAPEIWVDPQSFEITIPPGNTISTVLTIGNTGTDILDFEIGDAIAYLHHDADSGHNDWSYDGLWHITDHRSHSYTNAWYYGIEGQWNYDTGGTNSGSLHSPAIDLTNAQAPALTFWRWEETEGGDYYDHRHVYVSADSGASWQNVYASAGLSQREWVHERISFSAFAGNGVLMRFEFDTLDPAANDYEGWYVDDIRVFDEVLALEWCTESPTSGAVNPGQQATVTLAIDSTGLQSQNEYMGYIMIESNDPGEGTVYVPITVSIAGVPGDLDGDGDVDLDDLELLLARRGEAADGPDDPYDLDGDGWITALDARILVTLCTRPGCATEDGDGAQGGSGNPPGQAQQVPQSDGRLAQPRQEAVDQ